MNIKIIIILFLIFFTTSCSIDLFNYKYLSFRNLRKGQEKSLTLPKYEFDQSDAFLFEFKGVKYEIFYKKTDVIGGSFHDYFILVFVESKLYSFGALEDFRRNDNIINRKIAKFITGKI